ncbi:MAG: TIGR03960 family B12-binding radical SAM protein [Ilumatobacter sp.]|uniref:TIGR03960 family B12-binding radical SAM protein n=1 Tax=Ilumatobacter sp. TaxID=1967498 RepID=UPI002621C44C|nr:TIGR03960 family B12-binding radical SAM protein [Ilumatobacter sp.]MDJ0771275.1 TIGR03960 family B12-binding radical SAM protein [Ilumatobacter sp.]
MSTLWARIEPLLARVQKPARYIGCEDGAITPRHDEFDDGGAVAWLLAYPDTYEIGLPNQGLQILYEILNERDDALAERTYAPWTDLDREMRAAGVPLFSIDTHRAAADFDILAFNLSSELVYTNVLNMLDLAGTPLHAVDRGDDDLVVIVGGHAAFNPEPLADFIDAAVLGEGEEVVAEITEVVRRWKADGRRDRAAMLRQLSRVPGVYVPSMYEATYDGERLLGIAPRFDDVPATVDKRTVADLGDWPYPKNPLVPLTEVVHDRLSVEVFRGCTRGCRFCQAGMITRPVRERPAEQVRTMIRDGLRTTGYDEVALTSLSTADFSDIEPVVRGVLEDAQDVTSVCDTLTISLPSLRVDAFTVGLAGEVNTGRRSGLTFAPEGGSWRLRQVINKLITEEDLYGAVESAFSQGWTRMKLYFLTGLPTETDEDTLGIAELARNCVAIGKRYTPRASVTVSLGGFVPKPHTPFQWFGQNTEEELRRKIDLVRDATRKMKGVNLKWHRPEASVAEGIASRGDRRIGAVIERVWRAGGTFQEWGEHFDVDLWTAAMEAEGLSMDRYVFRHRDDSEVLPWDHLTAGLHKDFLWGDWLDALAESGVEDCRWTPCYDCGVCTGYGIEHVVASPMAPAGGSQGTGQDLTRGGEVPVQLLPRQPERVGAQ